MREREKGGGGKGEREVTRRPRTKTPLSHTHNTPSLSLSGTPRAFFKGNGANVLKIAPETALKLTANDRLKRLLASDPASITPGERFVAGAAAGAVAQTAIYPLELIRTRLALCESGRYRGIAHAAHSIIVQEGWRAFYRGLAPSFLGILPYAGVDIATFELIKEWLLDVYDGRPPPAAVLAAGAVSSSVAQVCSYPLALTRTRLQAQGAGGAPLKYSGMGQVISRALQREGVRGLYKGLAPNLAKMAPAAGISWLVFEEVKQGLGLDPR